MTLRGRPLEASKTYKVAGWAPVTEGTGGEPVWDVVARYLGHHKVIRPPRLNQPPLIDAEGNPGIG